MCTRNGSVELDTNAFIFNVNAFVLFLVYFFSIFKSKPYHLSSKSGYILGG